MRWLQRGPTTSADATTIPSSPVRASGDAARVDLKDLVRRRCDVWAPRCRARGIKLQATLEPEPALDVPDEIAVVVDALLSNALRFCDHGDHVSVMLRVGDEVAELQVADTGIGILPDELPRVFDRFFRGSVGRERAIDGSGLGLSIAREIANAHGGRLRGDSVAGEGSCFRVTLPRSADHALVTSGL